MSGTDQIKILLSEIARSRQVLRRIEAYYDEYTAAMDAAVGALRELLRFRHFKRYYMEFDYDWDRLRFLQRKLSVARQHVATDLGAFEALLRSAE